MRRFFSIAIVLLVPAFACAQPKSAEQTRAAFTKILERPKVPLDAKAMQPVKLDGGLVQEWLTYALSLIHI